MNINVCKSCCVIIGKRYDATCVNITTLSGLPLTWMREFRYLGINIVSALTFKCSTSVCKRSFFKAANSIFGRVGTTASEEVFRRPRVEQQFVNSHKLLVFLRMHKQSESRLAVAQRRKQFHQNIDRTNHHEQRQIQYIRVVTSRLAQSGFSFGLSSVRM